LHREDHGFAARAASAPLVSFALTSSALAGAETSLVASAARAFYAALVGSATIGPTEALRPGRLKFRFLFRSQYLPQPGADVRLKGS
jgi:hypothetical protein